MCVLYYQRRNQRKLMTCAYWEVLVHVEFLWATNNRTISPLLTEGWTPVSPRLKCFGSFVIFARPWPASTTVRPPSSTETSRWRTFSRPPPRKRGSSFATLAQLPPRSWTRPNRGWQSLKRKSRNTLLSHTGNKQDRKGECQTQSANVLGNAMRSAKAK